MKIISTASLFLLFLSLNAQASRVTIPKNPKEDVELKAMSSKLHYPPVMGDKGMIVSASPLAAKYGVHILNQGGNAIDAAVATAFAMAVTLPQNSSLGGGGFLVYCPNKKPQCQVIDYRETAPQAAHRDMYIRKGKADSRLSQDGPLASGTPGVVAGLLRALEKWGKFSRKKLLKYPIELAEDGFPINSSSQRWFNFRWKSFNSAAKEIFSCGNRDENKKPTPCNLHQKLRQKDLAAVLEQISKRGKDGFYKNWVAQKIAQGFKDAGGILTQQDLANYAVVERKPLQGNFRGFQIVSMPPPSAGGANLLAMLHYTEQARKSGQLKNGYGSSKSIHAMAHAMSLAFADRARYFGDADHGKVPYMQLIDPSYLNGRWKTFNPRKARIPKGPGKVARESNETTHLSVIDAQGNAVAITTTINYPFGSGFVPPGTGIVMNDEMDDFSAQPGKANAYGLVQGKANAIGPGKRPLSSMSPTIVRDAQHNNRLVIGAAGGPRITTSVYQSLVSRLAFQMPLSDAIFAPRFHHQWKPKTLFMEAGFAHEVLQGLSKKGWNVRPLYQGGRSTIIGRVHAIERFPVSGRVWGIPDPRGHGKAVAQ